jgi:hypothetical protein
VWEQPHPLRRHVTKHPVTGVEAVSLVCLRQLGATDELAAGGLMAVTEQVRRRHSAAQERFHGLGNQHLEATVDKRQL